MLELSQILAFFLNSPGISGFRDTAILESAFFSCRDAGTVKDEVLNVGRDVLKVADQCCWLGLRGAGCSSGAVWLLPQRGGEEVLA